MVKGQVVSVDNSLAAANTAQQVDLSSKLAGNEALITQLNVEADSGNTSLIKVGASNITGSIGITLNPGEDYTFVNVHWKDLYIRGANTDDVVHFTGVV